MGITNANEGKSGRYNPLDEKLKYLKGELTGYSKNIRALNKFTKELKLPSILEVIATEQDNEGFVSLLPENLKVSYNNLVEKISEIESNRDYSFLFDFGQDRKKPAYSSGDTQPIA